MNPRRIAAFLLCLPILSGCAARPAYFGRDAAPLRENGVAYWEGSARTAAYLQVRMRRRSRAPAREATLYAGTLRLESAAPAVLRSSFTLTEGESRTFRFDVNAAPGRESARAGRASRYFPAALDVSVSCAQGTCWADSKPVPISTEGRVELTFRKIRSASRAASGTAKKTDSGAVDDSLKKDRECATLHDGLRDRDAEAAARAARRYEQRGCAAWLDAHGGAGAAWRRVRVSQWTSLQGN